MASCPNQIKQNGKTKRHTGQHQQSFAAQAQCPFCDFCFFCFPVLFDLTV
jgi:hypothetical protein